jgi:hypothetical protein
MKEYLIAFQYRIQFENWRWAKIIKRCKLTGENIPRIEDEIAKTINADFVRIMTFSELEQEGEGL